MKYDKPDKIVAWTRLAIWLFGQDQPLVQFLPAYNQSQDNRNEDRAHDLGYELAKKYKGRYVVDHFLEPHHTSEPGITSALEMLEDALGDRGAA